MKLRLERDWLLLGPMVLAFVLRKAHDSLMFLPVFILAGAQFLVLARRWKAWPVPLFFFLPFGLYLLWCWAGLMGGAPGDIFLFLYSRQLLYVMVGVLIFQFAGASIPRRFEKCILALACVESAPILVAAIMERVIRWVGPQWAGHLGNPLHSGIIIPVGFGIALAWLQRDDLSRIRKAGLITAVVAMAAAVFFLRSRAGLIALGALLVYFYPRKMAWFALASAILGTTWMVLQRESFLVYFEIDKFLRGSTLGRFGIWSTAIDAIFSRPMTGYGLGNFESAFRLFQHPSVEFLRYGKSTIFTHNGFLQTTVETGVPGALLLFWGLGTALKPAARFFFKERALFSIIIVFFVTSLTNYSLFHPFNGLVFTTAVALLAAKAMGRNNIQPAIDFSKVRLLPTFIISLLTIFLASYGISEAFQKKGRLELSARACPIRSEAWYELALENLRQSKDALPFLNRALAWNGQNSFYWQRKALILMSQDPQDGVAILQCFKRAQALAPFHAPFYIQEGFYQLQRKQWGEARNLFEKAASLEPIVPLPHLGLALVHKQQGDLGAAKLELDLVRSLQDQKRQLEADPKGGWIYAALFNSEYGRFLFGVGENYDRFLR